MGAGPSTERVRRGAGPVQSLARALELLEALQRRERATIAELADLHGVHRATTLRLLQTLERFGYVTRGETRGEFRLGLKLYELGMVAGARSDLLSVARPIMRDLARTTGETIDLALYDDGEMVLIESIAGRPHARVGSAVGQRVVATNTTTGKLHLATRPLAEVERALRREGPWRLGPKRVTDPARYLAELECVRAQGYAVNDEETDPGVRFLGVAIDLPAQENRPVLILGAPVHRLPTSAYAHAAQLLRAAGRRIAAQIA